MADKGVQMSRLFRAALVISLAFILVGSLPVVLGQRERAGREADGAGECRLDRDGDGYISYREFHSAVNGRLEDNQVRRIFDAADANDDGKLSKRELLSAGRMIIRLKMEEVRDRIHRPDSNGDGVLTLREFHSFLDERMDSNTIKRIFNAADQDGNGELSRREQFQAMRLIKNYLREKARERIHERLAQREGDDGGDGASDGEGSSRTENERGLDRRGMVRRIMNAMDRDGNGRISPEELLRAFRMMRRVLNA